MLVRSLLWLALSLPCDAIRLSERHLFRASRRVALCAGGLVAAAVAAPGPLRTLAATEEFTFREQRLGFTLVQDFDRVRIDQMNPNSPAISQGVAPQSAILGVNGEGTAGLNVAKVQSMIRSAPRPVTLQLDGSAFRALSAVEQAEAAATALGMTTERIGIELLTGPQDPGCGFRSREGDVVEVEFSASVAADAAAEGLRRAKREFDSSAMRSGRPFAFMLGNGDVVRGFELGTVEMCIGEERLVRVPARLGFGARGSKVYGVPPDAALEYRIRLVSINGVGDPRARREDQPDEQRFREDSEGNVINAASE
jgi:FK506-binding protein 2